MIEEQGQEEGGAVKAGEAGWRRECEGGSGGYFLLYFIFPE